MVPFGTVMFSPSRMTLGLLFGPYFLKALLTYIACFRFVSKVETCVLNCDLLVFSSKDAAGTTGGLLAVSMSKKGEKRNSYSRESDS